MKYNISTQRIFLPNKIYKILKRLERKRKNPKWLVERVSIVMLASRGLGMSEIAEKLGINRKTVRRWCQRWFRGMEGLQNGMDDATLKSLEMRIISLFGDEPRSGTPAKFTPEQITCIIAVACEDPQESDRPISHWTARELALEVVKLLYLRFLSAQSIAF